MTLVARASGLVVNRADNPDLAIPFRGIQNSHPVLQTDGDLGRFRAMADETGLGVDVGCMVDFRKLIGEFDLAAFVINPDILDVLLPGDVLNDLIDVVAGIVHHGIMGA